MKIITLLKYIFLGIIQGITEPLPISSSGHIFLLKKVLNTNIGSDLNFEIIVNAGSLLAVLIIYKDEILSLIKSFICYIFKKDNKSYLVFNYSIKIIIGIIPAMIVGLLFKDYIESKLNNIKIIGISFLITSIFLFLSRNKIGNKEKDQITYKDSLLIGLSQILALIPGISRSGTTYVTALHRNINRKDALKYSFMMYIPISLGTLILGIKDLVNSNINLLFIPYFIGFIFAFMTSLITLKWFINKVNNKNLVYFSLYCLILSVITLFFV